MQRLAAFAFSLLLLATPAFAQTPATIAIDNFVFKPEVLTVPAGTKVTWTNEDDIPHLVVDIPSKNGDPLYRSPALDTDDSFSFTFTEPGTYDFFCALHPHMVGKIVVE